MVASFGFDLETKHDRQPQWRKPPEKGPYVVVNPAIMWMWWCNLYFLDNVFALVHVFQITIKNFKLEF